MQVYYFNIIVKKQISWIGAFVLLMSLSSCNDIFEKNIGSEKPMVILPTADDMVFSNKVHFKWDELEGATFYNLQIVQPSFADIDAFVLDSNINGDEFYFVLPPGDYQFQIRGENSAYQSMFTGPYSIYVDSISDLSAQFVSLVAPIDNKYINGASDVMISWQNLFAANSYQYILKIGDSFETGSVLDQDLNINTLAYTIPASFFSVEGTYFWGVRGVNLTGESSYSTHQLNVDLTAPNNAELTLPVDDFTGPITEDVTLKWLLGADPGTVHSPITSTVEISTTESFIDFTAINGITSDSLVYTFPTEGDYWWRVKLIDEVGNQSEFYSVERKITIE